MRRAIAAAAAALALGALSARAQSGPPPLRLSLADAIHGALTESLGAQSAHSRVEIARAVSRQERADLLPEVAARIGAQRQIINLEAYGFPPPPGESALVGPFGVADARVTFAQPLLNMEESHEARAAKADVRAAEADAADTRDLVVLLAANAYLRTLAAEARVRTIEAESDVARAQLGKARDMRESGLLAGVDVVRVELQDASARQRLLEARADRERSALALARLAGLPLERPIVLTDEMPYAALHAIPLEEALRRAESRRGDVLRAQARVAAAESRVKAARAEALPTLGLLAAAGEIGPPLDDLGFTWSVGAAVRVPIFDGGRRGGEIAEAEETLLLRRAEAKDALRGAEVDVRTALLDVSSTAAALDVARSGRELADRLLEQARDRFAAGVAGSIEATKAQEDLVAADERWVAGLYSFNVAKASLARAMGVGEEAAAQLLDPTHE